MAAESFPSSESCAPRGFRPLPASEARLIGRAARPCIGPADRSAICADFCREVLASRGVAAVRKSCVIRCRATPAEPFERSGIDEPFATSMTQLPMDRLRTFSVYFAVEKPSVRGISAVKT
jgi:hypothetical protein